jgi:flagellar biosynthesis protein FlhF
VSTDLRTFRGETLEDTLRAVREELGPEAIVLREREGVIGGVGGFFGKRCVELDVAAAAPAAPAIDLYDSGDDDEPAVEPDLMRTLVEQASPFAAELADAVERFVPEPFVPEPIVTVVQEAAARPLLDPAATRRRLVDAGFEERLAADVVAEAESEHRLFAPEDPFLDQVRTVLARRIRVARPSRKRRRVVALVGGAGSGKTLTAARLCHAHATGAEERSVAALSIGPVRKALELGRSTEGIDVELAVAAGRRELRLELAQLAAVELLVVDTPALAPGDRAGLRALGGLLDVVEPDETHLLLPASLNAAAIEALLDEAVPALAPDRLLLTQLDGRGGIGAAIAASIRRRIPISFTATGAAWGLRPADPYTLAGLVLQ